MSVIPSTAEGGEHLAMLRRLVRARWIALGLLATLTLVAPVTLAIRLPQLPLLGLLGTTALFNVLAAWRLRRADAATHWELFSHLLIDIAALTAMLFFSGGATNPLVSLLLPPVALAALTLPARGVVATGIGAVAGYSTLMAFYVPLAVGDAARAAQLHLLGMWLTFAVSAVLIAWIVMRMTALIRQRDAELAAVREQALRDERIMAIATLAAGAAHELGTPLATMALVAGELAHETQLPDALREDIALLRQQVAVCKEIVTGLSRRAGAERLENSAAEPVDRWLDGLRRRWHAARPHAASRLAIAGMQPVPTIVSDPRIEQALFNLLNNAANASAAPVELAVAWPEGSIVIEIRDHGPGFPAAVLAQAGVATFPPHAQGSGIGLLLTRTAIEQLGGRLLLLNPPEGGALARLELPRSN